MLDSQKLNILLVDDQPEKLVSYEVILQPLGENLIKAASAREALEHLLKTEIAVVLVDVCMPELDGFKLAAMIREHPRFQSTAIIFVSAVLLDDADRLRGYSMGAVDYVPVPVIPDMLRAKVRVFADLYRKTKALQGINAELERRVEERTVELQKALDHQTLLAREVDHRAKNVLAVAQSLIRMSRGSTIDSYREIIEGRLRALSFAHVLFSQSRWQGAELRKLAEEELAPYRGSIDRVTIKGPDLFLKPAVAQNLTLCLHELATNAAKYGALSVETGMVDFSWELSGGVLAMNWQESGGPLVFPPEKTGVGSRIIASTVRSHFGGQLTMEWRPEGLACTFNLPLESPSKQQAEKGKAKASPVAEIGASSKKRILLVEDEPLVAMMMVDMLIEFGFNVVGPFNRVSDAALAMRTNDLMAAVLDVSLGDEVVFPLAELLQAKRVPFLFVTGYDGDHISETYKGVTVLSKPVDREKLQWHLSEWLDTPAMALQQS